MKKKSFTIIPKSAAERQTFFNNLVEHLPEIAAAFEIPDERVKEPKKWRACMRGRSI
jgi:hypothetical protein